MDPFGSAGQISFLRDYQHPADIGRLHADTLGITERMLKNPSFAK